MTAQIDRSPQERSDPGLLDAARADPATRVLVCAGDRAPLDAPDALLHVAPSAVPDGAVWAFLGRGDDGSAQLAAVFAPQDADLFAAPAGWGVLRVVGGDLAESDTSLFITAVSLGRWLLDAAYCPACGTRTELRAAGWARTCPACRREHFPRTDPAAIVAVRSARHPDRLLLGSNALWGGDRYSCFAGFAEAGESLESAAVREVREEAGVDLVDLDYRGSQAWPYPRSLMVGFLATAADDDAAEADGDEIAAVRWFTRNEIGEALAGRGPITLPGRASIARRLIVSWYEESA